MDRRISRKRSPLRLALFLALGALALWGISTLLSELSVSRLRVQRDRLMISTVDSGPLAGSPAATRLARGAFFQSTGGQWVFVIDENGEEAVRRPVRLGRRAQTTSRCFQG